MSDSSLNSTPIKNKRSIKLGNIAAKGYLGLIYILLYLPIIVLVVMSFNKSKIVCNLLSNISLSS